MLLLVVLKTLVEELDVARDVLLIDEATRERLTLVILTSSLKKHVFYN